MAVALYAARSPGARSASGTKLAQQASEQIMYVAAHCSAKLDARLIGHGRRSVTRGI